MFRMIRTTLFTLTALAAVAALSLAPARVVAQEAAPDITGAWHGTLDVQGTSLRLVISIEKAGDGYRATVDSPDQGATGIPVASTMFEYPALKLTLPDIGASYEGTLAAGVIDGTWSQSGRAFPLTLQRKP